MFSLSYVPLFDHRNVWYNVQVTKLCITYLYANYCFWRKFQFYATIIKNVVPFIINALSRDFPSN